MCIHKCQSLIILLKKEAIIYQLRLEISNYSVEQTPTFIRMETSPAYTAPLPTLTEEVISRSLHVCIEVPHIS